MFDAIVVGRMSPCTIESFTVNPMPAFAAATVASTRRAPGAVHVEAYLPYLVEVPQKQPKLVYCVGISRLYGVLPHLGHRMLPQALYAAGLRVNRSPIGKFTHHRLCRDLTQHDSSTANHRWSLV